MRLIWAILFASCALACGPAEAAAPGCGRFSEAVAPDGSILYVHVAPSPKGGYRPDLAVWRRAQGGSVSTTAYVHFLPDQSGLGPAHRLSLSVGGDFRAVAQFTRADLVVSTGQAPAWMAQAEPRRLETMPGGFFTLADDGRYRPPDEPSAVVRTDLLKTIADGGVIKITSRIASGQILFERAVPFPNRRMLSALYNKARADAVAIAPSRSPCAPPPPPIAVPPSMPAGEFLALSTRPTSQSFLAVDRTSKIGQFVTATMLTVLARPLKINDRLAITQLVLDVAIDCANNAEKVLHVASYDDAGRYVTQFSLGPLADVNSDSALAFAAKAACAAEPPPAGLLISDHAAVLRRVRERFPIGQQHP